MRGEKRDDGSGEARPEGTTPHAGPVVAVAHLIDRRAPTPAPRPLSRPDLEIRQEVIWAEAPSEPEQRALRAAATVRTEVMHRAPPPRPPRRGIGSMEPQGRG
jgi:hypothetical protein